MNMDRVERRLSSLVYAVMRSRYFFFFQAEDGIRDIGVTGVQTCALPIWDCLDALTPGKQAWPRLREAVLDGAFVAERCEAWCNLHGVRRRVVERDPAQKGFVVLERRWAVERSFGWLVHWGGLLRDRAGRLDVSAARVALAAVLSGVEALINPMPIQDTAT